jgi:hypothetical protein
MGKDQPAPPSSQTVTNTNIPEYARPYVERMLGKAEALSKTPYQAYGGERMAGFNNLQNQAFNEAANLGPAKQIGVGTQLAGAAGLGSLQAGQNYQNMATDPSAMQAYMSPYIQGALNPAMDEARRQSGLTGLQNQAAAIKAGAFGGSGRLALEGERQRNLGQLQNQIYGEGMQKAFQNAQQAQQFGSTLGLQGYGQALQSANTMGQLGQTQFNQQQQAMNARMQAGTQQQAFEQQKLQQQYQDFLTQKGYPQQQLSYMSDMLRGLPLSQGTQQQYQAPPSWLAQAAGIGFLGKGLGAFAEGGEVENKPAGLAELALMRMSED